MMSNINHSKTTLCQNCYQDLVIFSCKSLIFCKFVRDYIDSTELIFTAIYMFDEHKILVKNINKKHRWLLTYKKFKTAKKITIQLIKQIICWHCNDKEILILKEVVINANNDLLILYFRNVKCQKKDACMFCQNSLNSLKKCIIDSYFDLLMNLDACLNCSWNRHSDRCSFYKFSLLLFQVIKHDTYKKMLIKKNKMTTMTAKWISTIAIMNQVKRMMSNL